MKKQWKKEQRMCSNCHDKLAIRHRHGCDHEDGQAFDDMCPRCARDFENRLMAQSIAQQATLFVLDDYRPVHNEFVTEAVPLAATA